MNIDASGVSLSDLSIVPPGGVPKLPPLILGHEGTGTILEIGVQVRG